MAEPEAQAQAAAEQAFAQATSSESADVDRDSAITNKLVDRAERTRAAAEEALDTRVTDGATGYAVFDHETTALKAELLAWVAAHGSDELRSSVAQAMAWDREHVPDRARYELALDQLRAEIADEWVTQHRPGWVAWEPLNYDDHEDFDDGLELHGGGDWREQYSNPTRLQTRYASEDVQVEARSAPVIDLLASAQQVEPKAKLATYYSSGSPLEPGERNTFFCAVAEIRLPGSRDYTQIVMREPEEHARKLDMIAHVLGTESPYAAKLAAISEIEYDKPATLIETNERVVGRLARVENAHGWCEDRRAVIVTDRAVHILLLDKLSRVDESIGREIALQKTGKGVLLQSPALEGSLPASMHRAVEDIEGLEQHALRREIDQRGQQSTYRAPSDESLARLARVTDRAESLLRVSKEADAKARPYYRLQKGEPDPAQSLLAVDANRAWGATATALTTERMAWTAAHGSPPYYPGWTPADPELELRPVSITEGSRPAGQLRAALLDSRPVAELLATAKQQAPDAQLAIACPAASVDRKSSETREQYCAVISRRLPGTAHPQSLVRGETPAQKIALDALFEKRRASIGPLIERVENEFGRAVARVPNNQPVTGRLVRIEHCSDHRDRAVVVNEKAVHIVSVLRSPALEQHVGHNVTLTKSAEIVRISGLQPKQEMELGRW